MRLFVAGLMAEVNSFSPVPTGWGAFESEGIRRPGSDANPGGVLAALDAVRTTAIAAGWNVVEGLFAAAQPLGPVVHAVYEALRDEIVAGLRAAGRVDAVVLLLHGAMLTDACDDCEGDLLDAVRAVVGPDVPIGVELDLHCHFTARMRAATPLHVAYKEYPHVDAPERASELTRLTLDAARGRIHPVLAAVDLRMTGLWPTTREPLRDFVRRLRELEGRDGILSISLAHGFAYGDVPEAGAKLWVIADADTMRAAALADSLGRELWAMREAIGARAVPLDDALDRIPPPGGDRIAIADLADNPGGGARGDSTFVLARLLERRMSHVALAGFWDPGAVQICREAGLGAQLRLRVGGKCGPTSGAPVDVVATVHGLADDHWQSDFGQRSPLGPSAWVRTDTGLDVVLISRCQQVLGLEMFTGLGVDLARQRAYVVKSSQHFHAAFAPWVSEVIHVSTPGLLRPDIENLPFRRRDPAFWPRVADPFARGGAPSPSIGER